MRKILFKFLSISVTVAFISSSNPARMVFAQEQMESQDDQADKKPEAPKDEIFNILTGEVLSIDTKNLTRVAVANPEIIDISDAKADKIFIAGKKTGQTEIFVWDDNGKRDITVRVASENLEVLRMRIQEALDRAGVKGVYLEKNELEGKVVLYGSIPKPDKDMLEKIMDPYTDKIINLVKQEIIEDMVQVDIQVIELSTTLSKQIGLDWSGTSGGGGSTGIAGSSTTNTGAASSASGLNLNYNEKGLPQTSGGTLFNLQSFHRTTPISVAVNALLAEGKARVLSKPRLIVMSGKEASFLVGGEVPIQSTTTSATGGGSIGTSVTFKQYGVNMTVTPTIREGKIDVLLNVQISDIDKSTQDKNGDVGYITRQAQTHLFLDDKQNIVMAGIIKHSEGVTVTGVPYLSKIPVFGAMFRSRSSANPDSDTELVISLTPTILKSKKIATEQVVMPSKRVNNFANEVEGNFEKESIENTPKEKTKPSVKKSITKTKIIKPIVLASSRVPSMIVLSYVRSIQYRISQAIAYPPEAMQRDWEGTVKLRIRVLRDGTLADCDLLESSGYDAFDMDAINTTKKVGPFLPFPNEMKQEDLVIMIPIVYNQRASSDRNTQTVVASY